MSERDDTHPELEETARALRAERAEPDADVLGRAYRRARAPRHRQPRSPMALLVLVLTLGILMTGAGATLAVSGLSSDGTAAQTEYDDDQDVEDETVGSEEEDGDDGGAQDKGTEGAEQPARQVAAADGDSLPFTGFAAIPVLVIGLALLASGLALRRRTSNDS